MEKLIGVKLYRLEENKWGFSMKGGKDFGGNLIIKKVNGGRKEEKEGMKEGDEVIKVNEVEVLRIRNKEEKD